jgi:tetratricopeptide (TPR) repeat protein
MTGGSNGKLVDIKSISRERRGSISVCMIARDEEAHIGAALDSVKDLADEMIVVDTGSADLTVPEARRRGARVFAAPWTNDFSEARNVALSKASCRWILVLDADECLSSADHGRIRDLVRGDERAAYRFEQRTYLGADDGFVCAKVDADDEMSRGAAACFTDRQVRLFRNERFIRYACEIHENLEESLLLAGHPVRESGIVVHHYGRLDGGDRVARKAALWCALGREGLDAYPAHPRYLFELAVRFLDCGVLDAAVRHLDTALAAEPSSFRLWNAAGLVHLRKGDPGRAALCFKKALRDCGRNAEVFNNMGAALMESRESAEALLWFERAAALEEDDPAILRNAASACLLAGEGERARDYIERSLAADPFAAHSHAILADILLRRRDADGAARVLERMRFLPDIPFKVHLKAIQLHVRMHRLEEADAAAERALEAFPGRDDLLYLCGKIAELRGDDERAASLYRRALATRPDHAEALSSLGCIFDRQERFTEALAAFREALRHAPSSTQIEVNLGIVFDKLGHAEEAGRCFARAMESGERSGFAYNALGCHHARSNRFDEAFSCFAKAVELEENPLYYQNLGLACERMRLYEKAAEVYEKLASIDRQAASFARERLAWLRAAAGAGGR